MVQYISKGDIFGRIGSNIGQGLAEQIPKEVERNRLKQGLEELSQQKNLTPFQRFSGLISQPGITPQGIQTGGELLAQEARGDQLAKYYDSQNKINKPNPFPKQNNKQSQIVKEAPSITQEAPLEEIQEGYIPPTQDQIFEEAGRRFEENAALFGNDPEKAIEAAEKDALRKEKINEAYQRKHQNLTAIQDNVVKRLQAQSDKLGSQIVPSNVYSKIEDKAIQATKSKKLGGEGLTEQQAIKKYGDELDSIARDYTKINSIDGWGITSNKPNSTLRAFEQLQDKFEKRDDLKNFANKLISKEFSPSFAFSIAQPINKVPELNKLFKNLPEVPKSHVYAGTRPDPRISIPKTLEIAPNLAQILKNNSNASPLAIAYELNKKNYDPETFLQYVTDHMEDLNLKADQIEQLEERYNLFPTWNDWWLSSWSGIKE